ncbi:hypothetical protein V1477_012641 [Vespula maculifrons]|uniref:Uncharacterized protein n=1 Tax=Vespula maculifrons TaxID=7453 RepID=A0ABD2BTN2_VESMC
MEMEEKEEEKEKKEVEVEMEVKEKVEEKGKELDSVKEEEARGHIRQRNENRLSDLSERRQTLTVNLSFQD